MIFEDERAAPEDRLGFVLHLGDFIYEVVQYPEEQPTRYDRTIYEVARIPGGEKIGLVKMDVEGHELPALRGAERTVRRDLPLLLVEVEERMQPVEPILALLGDDASVYPPLVGTVVAMVVCELALLFVPVRAASGRPVTRRCPTRPTSPSAWTRKAPATRG